MRLRKPPGDLPRSGTTTPGPIPTPGRGWVRGALPRGAVHGYGGRVDIYPTRRIRWQDTTIGFPFAQSREIGWTVFLSPNSNDPLLGHALIIGQDLQD